jgi:AGZA family xanthine/uracil permease-like MFS transporter
MLGSTLNAAQTVGALAPDKVAAVKSAAITALPQQGVLYHGLEVMGGGSILAGLVLGAIVHGEAVGIGGGLGVTPAVALAYALVAAAFFAVGKFGTSAAPVPHPEMPVAAPAE